MGLTSNGFLGSNRRCGLIRLQTARDMIVNGGRWLTADGSRQHFSDIIFEANGSRLSILNDPIENIEAVLHAGAAVRFLGIGTCVAGSNIHKSNVLTSGTVKEYSMEYVTGGLDTKIFEEYDIELPEFPIRTVNHHEMVLANRVNTDIRNGKFTNFYNTMPLALVPVLGNRKADAVLHYLEHHHVKIPVRHKYYVSHKAGSFPTDFRQWSGISQAAGKDIHDNPIVKRIRDIVTASGYKPGTKATIPFLDGSGDSIDLAMRAMYGTYSAANGDGAHAILFGVPAPDQSEEYFVSPNNCITRYNCITRSSMSVDSLNLPSDLMPVFSLQPASDRHVNIHGLVLPNTRIGISPAGCFGR